MIMFLVLNTSGLTIIPISIMVYRAQMGAAQPTDVFVPILLATFFSTLAGIITVSLYQRINLLNRTILLFLGGASLFIAGIIWFFTTLSRQQIDTYSTTTANVFLFVIIIGFIIAGMRKRINVYDAFVEGAKEGFTTAVRIILSCRHPGGHRSIPSFRMHGYLIRGVAKLTELCGINSDFVGALPTALMKPLSGSGARGLMVDAMSTYGADSFIGRMACVSRDPQIRRSTSWPSISEAWASHVPVMRFPVDYLPILQVSLPRSSSATSFRINKEDAAKMRNFATTFNV